MSRDILGTFPDNPSSELLEVLEELIKLMTSIIMTIIFISSETEFNVI